MLENQDLELPRGKGNYLVGIPVRIVKFVFTLIAWVTLGLILYPFRRHPLVKKVPNIVTGVRMALTIPATVCFGFALWQGNEHQAEVWLLAMALIAALDAIDGPLARILEAETDLGKLLDPAADKLLVLSMLLLYVVVSYHDYGVLMAVAILGIVIWVLRVEFALVMIARTTAKQVIALRDQGQAPKLMGANIFGKFKMNLQMLAIFIGYFWMIKYPDDPVGPVMMISILMIARWFADKSLGQHRKDLEKLYP